MFVKKLIALLAVLMLCLPVAIFANGVTPPEEEEDVVTPPTQPGNGAAVVPPPTGAGPTELAGPISVAPISAIQQRGHSANQCEAQVMLHKSIRESGGVRVFGDYQVAYMLDPPMGSYANVDGDVTWVPPAPTDTQHIEVVVMDSLTGQMLPIQPTVDVIDQQGNVVQSKQLEYYWHPMAAHYGANFAIPTAGNYSLRVRAPMPNIRRHDRELGDRFTTPLDATFTNIRISPEAPPVTPPSGAGPDTPEVTTDTEDVESVDDTQPVTPPDSPDDTDY